MEAMIVLSDGWLYYKIHTRLNTAKEALTEFTNAAKHAGINIDNLNIEKVVLRDAGGRTLDEMSVVH